MGIALDIITRTSMENHPLETKGLSIGDLRL